MRYQVFLSSGVQKLPGKRALNTTNNNNTNNHQWRHPISVTNLVTNLVTKSMYLCI